jgi:hypothetical protein
MVNPSGIRRPNRPQHGRGPLMTTLALAVAIVFGFVLSFFTN